MRTPSLGRSPGRGCDRSEPTEITFATGSCDIDKDELSYTWRFYPEAGTYLGWIDTENANSKSASFMVPTDASGATLHILLILTDDGAPPLTRYRRLLFCGEGGRHQKAGGDDGR